MRMRALHLTDFIMAGAVVWGALLMWPATWWYQPVRVFINNSTPAEVPAMTIERNIKRNALIEYNVVLREIGNPKAICDAEGGPFPYKKQKGEIDDPNWAWWTGHQPDCWPLSPGNYVADTCHTVVKPFWGLTFPKTVCITSNVFTVTVVSAKEAEEAIETTRGLKLEVQRLNDELKQVEQQQQTIEQEIEGIDQ